ncbi:hypothetical protein BC374_26195 [Ensifer sp. LC13]|nr:hypothetical protein BBX50_26185 [Ensifer sp. LC11]OCP04382.1 hypothetical protein BC374_26195 [Ensifer sp. LC13]OCP08540.1 hypothetical protein BC362_01685 [Ensifer sp. LC14]OCP30435.1 hypothetical protein BC364_26465 [Ensifer sp. LC499]
MDAKADHAAAGTRKKSRFARSVPAARELVIGASLWGAAMTLSAWFGLWLRERALTFHLSELLVLFGVGALMAWPPSLFLARFAALERRIETRFAAYLFFLALGTIGMTAMLFALDYRAFYAQWHAPVGTRTWLFQFAFTTAIAFYQFLVMGLRLYLPVGGAILLGVSLWLANGRGEQR